MKRTLAALTLIAAVTIAPAALTAAEQEEGKGLYREPEKSPITITKSEADAKLLEHSNKSLELAERFTALVNKHLKAAGNYEIDTFRKTDDEIAALFEEMDANYLDSRMIYDALGLSGDQLAAQKKALQDSKMMMYKSSAIFNLCFGRPLSSAQCARLALNLSQHGGAERESEADIRYYLGTALTWAGDYRHAEDELTAALKAGKDKPYTQLKPGQTVNSSGRNPFTEPQLATVLLAQNQTDRAISLLNQTRTQVPSEEIQGLSDALLTVAYMNSPKTAVTASKASQHAAYARKELGASTQMYPGIAAEWLGITEAASGNYERAEKLLSNAIAKLAVAPLQSGHRLEAAQATLWRGYCRERLGNAGAAEQDLKYAMSFADEAPHLVTTAKMLDRLFGKKLTGQIGKQPRQKWALVIGVSDFADGKIPKLRYPKKDALDMAKFLIEKAGFQADHVKTLTDREATREQILDAIGGSWLPEMSKPDDLVYLFISSHGTPAYEDIGAMNSVVTYDTAVNKLFGTSIPMPTIVRLLASRLSKRHTFVVLDTCYAGGLGVPFSKNHVLTNVDPDLLLSSNYQLLVSSSSGKERSWESKRYPNSVFTRQMIDTIDAHRDYERFDYVFPEIQNKVSAEVAADHKGIKQTPSLSGLWSGRGLY